MKRNAVRRLLAGSCAWFALLMLGGTTAVASSGDPKTGGRLIFAAEQEPTCLNGLLAACNGTWTSWTAGISLAGAYRVAPNFSFEPVLVDHVDVETRPATDKRPFALTYHIKDEATWSDGAPVSADDFIFTLDITLDAGNDMATRRGYDRIAEAVKLDEKTVRFVFTRPYAAWKTLFGTVLPEHVLAGQDFNQVWQGEIADPTTHVPIGSGPFLVTSYVRGQSLALSRNPRWWGPACALSRRHHLPVHPEHRFRDRGDPRRRG